MFPYKRSPSHRNQRRKTNKRNPIAKEEVKMSLFPDDIIPFIENPKHATRKLLELINEFGKVAGYKINIQKSVAVLYNEKRNSSIPSLLPLSC